jgi:cation diffusion facilitator CzcD-associated flavoprotein CzcO
MNAPFGPALEQQAQVAIIGAGFSGLGMGRALMKSGRADFLILERARCVGGTWRDNTYPGCACDVPSRLYSFSFAQNPDWSRTYSPQSEILTYLESCVDRFGLREKLRLGTEVLSATFDESAALWRIETNRGPLAARALIVGTGPLNKPLVPRIKGLETFAGHAFHSCEWDHRHDLTGKRVAVIGTGASAIQFVPEIAPKVARLHLFQRTAPWILPRIERAFTPAQKKLFRDLPFLQQALRDLTYWRMEMLAIGFTLRPRMLAKIEEHAKELIERSIADPALRAKVTPTFQVGCKRILFSNSYYRTLTRANVELVTLPIAEVRADTVRLTDGSSREVDTIIYGTGFRATDMLGAVEIRGREGRSLNAEWAKTARAYYGITVSGYPNLFFLAGPNTGLGHNSLIYMIEAQVHYILEALAALERRQAGYLDVKPEAQSAFNSGLDRRMKSTVWATGCRSWYLTEDGHNTTLWPSFTFRYKERTRRLKSADYEFVRAPARVRTS